MSQSFPFALAELAGMVVAIERGAALRALAALERRIVHGRLPDDARAEAIRTGNYAYDAASIPGLDLAQQDTPRPPRGIAVLPLMGVMKHRFSAIEQQSGGGGTSTAAFTAALAQAADDPSISAIVVHCDSPGGETHGVAELAAQVREAARVKPVIAQVSGYACSAALWAISGATEIVAQPSSTLGSVGVMALHSDVSQLLSKAGIVNTWVHAGEKKVALSPFAPLSADAKADVQQQVDAVHRMFLHDLAMGRRTTPAHVAAEYGQGGSVNVRTALRVGMIDRIGTMPETLRRMGATKAGSVPQSRVRAEIGTDLCTSRAATSADLRSSAAAAEFRRRRHAARQRMLEVL